MVGIPLSTNFDVGAALHLDSRGEITKAQMLTINENIWPEDKLTICSDDHKVYLFSKSNTSDPTTGKFREFTPGTQIEVDDEMSLTSTNPVQNKTISTALNGKVDVVEGKGLSTNDFTDVLKDKLDGIEAEAQVNTIESISVNGTPVSPDANKNVNIVVSGTTGDSIKYVTELPTSGIENIIYGLKEATGKITTIDLIKPVSGTLTKQQAIDYFSKYFTVTDVDENTIELTVYPDLVISRDNWGAETWNAGTDFNKLYYSVSSADLDAYMDSTLYASTGTWGETSQYYIHCTSTYFPTYKYYAGVESTQELNEIGAGGSVDDVIDDVETLPTSDVQNIFYRTTQEQIVTRYTDTTTTAIMTAMTPYGFTQGETVTNYETHTGNIYSTLTYLDNVRHVYDNFGKPLQIYMFQPQGESYYKLGCISNGVDAFWNANDPVGFKLGDNGLYTGKSSNNSTSRVAMFDEMSKTFRGTRTQWNALSTAEKKTYDGCALTDDYNAGGGGEIVVVDEVANGNLNPVTSNAVYNYTPAVNAIANPITRDTTHASDIQEIGAYKQGRIAQIKCYITFQNIANNTWNTLATVDNSLKPMMETPLIVSEGAVVSKVALFRLSTDGKIQIWANGVVDGDTTRVSATYFTAN